MPVKLALTLTLAFLATLVWPEAALAQQPSTIADSLCDIINMIQGPAGRAIASLAVIVVGISSLLGRVQWNQAIVVCVGIAVIFGAPEILQQMGGSNVQNNVNCEARLPQTPAPLLDGPIAQTLCNVVNLFSGTTGQALATIGIIIMGLMALMGKLAPSYALIVATGIAMVFGSASIVRDIAPDGTFGGGGGQQVSAACQPLIVI